jgi:cadmium resistance protein CadD (predicted permease)
VFAFSLGLFFVVLALMFITGALSDIPELAEIKGSAYCCAVPLVILGIFLLIKYKR